MGESKLRIQQIWIYPIKSLRGCTSPSHLASPSGFAYDRCFMLQRVSDDKKMQVSKFPEMCLFTTELSPPKKPTKVLVRYAKAHAFNKPDEKVDDEVLEIPLTPDWKADGLKERNVDMYSCPLSVYEMPDQYNKWFSKRFGYDVRLLYDGDNRRGILGTITPNAAPVFVNDNAKKAQGWFGSARSFVGGWISTVAGYGVDEDDRERYRGVDQGIGFPDVAPFLVVSSKSYENAAARISSDEKLDIVKFRPNIIVEGADEYFEEDFWAELAIGDTDIRIELTANCARCPSLNVDFDTGKPTGKILKLLQSDRRVDPGMKYSPVFGRYGFLARKGSTDTGDDLEVELKVGDSVTVVRRNQYRTRFQWPGISTDK